MHFSDIVAGVQVISHFSEGFIYKALNNYNVICVSQWQV